LVNILKYLLKGSFFHDVAYRKQYVKNLLQKTFKKVGSMQLWLIMHPLLSIF